MDTPPSAQSPDRDPSLPTRREVREANEAAVRDDLGLDAAPTPVAPGMLTPGTAESDPELLEANAAANAAAGSADADAASPQAVRTETAGAEAHTVVLDPVDGTQPTAVMESVPPVVIPTERDDAPDAAVENGPEPSGVAHINDPADGPAPDSANWMGLSAFVAGILALSPIAIILGHLGLSAAKKGRATNGSFALAGAVLGWIGLVATGIGVWLYLQGPSAEQIDIHAKQDIHAVGAEVATQVVATNELPLLADTGDAYTVGDVTLEQHLETSHDMSLTGTAPVDWCLQLTFDDGTVPAYSYLPTEGVVEGTCAG